MSLPYAVIIAGGQGKRLGGVRKADLRIGGRRQLERVLAGLDGVARPILVATGPRGQRLALPDDCRDVPDLESPLGGPLAGVAAAVAHLAKTGNSSGLLVSIAVDTVFLPQDFVARMIEGVGDAAAGFAAWREDFYPPNAIWRLEALQGLPAALGGPRAPASLRSLQHSLGARRVQWGSQQATNPFANINTLADLLALQRQALL